MLIIVVLGIVCSAVCGCLGTAVDTDMLLEKVAEKQQNIDSLAYVETLTLNIKNDTRTVEYDVHLKMPDKFRIIEKSGATTQSEVVANGDRIWIYNPKSNTVFIRNQTLSDKMPEPAIHSLISDTLIGKYTVEYQETESLNSTHIRKMKMVSRDSGNEDATEYLLWIDADHLIPLKLISYRGDYQAVTLEYPDYSINCITNDDEFTFTTPDGAYVVYL